MAGIAGAVRTLCMCALVLCCRGTALFPPIFDEDEPACVPSVAHQCSFVDQFKDPKSDRWIRADNYTNGEPFANYWSKGNAFVNPKFGRASMYLNKWRGPKFGKKFAGGHFLSKFWYGYGCFEARIKPSLQTGAVSAFFAYTGPHDRAPGATGHPWQHDEIDLEFIRKQGSNQTSLQTNYFKNHVGGNERMIDLPFDPEERFHNYGFKWTSRGIWWYVDEVEVYNVSSKTHSIPKQRESSLRIMMNLWVVSKAAAEWAGWFKFKKELVVRYDAVRYTKGESCRMKGFNNDLWRIRG